MPENLIWQKPLKYRPAMLTVCAVFTVRNYWKEWLHKQQDHKVFADKMEQRLNTELIICSTITEEKEVKILFELLEKRNEQGFSTKEILSAEQP